MGFLCLWQAVTAAHVLEFPSPLQVLNTFLRLCIEGDPVFGRTIPQMVGHSSVIILEGALLGSLLGLSLGVLLGASLRVRLVLRPVLALFSPIPPLAWLPVGYLVFAGTSRPSNLVQVSVVTLAVLFPVLNSTAHGVEYVPPSLTMVARTFGVHGLQLLRRVSLPAALPSILSGIRIGTSVGWMSIVAAEFVGGTPGIGFYIWSAYSVGGRMSEVLAGIVGIGLAGLAMNSLLVWAERRLTPWH